ncbi:hypothetical protein BH18ACT2_BH18ACT2_19650 [soil metagenome]
MGGRGPIDHFALAVESRDVLEEMRRCLVDAGAEIGEIQQLGSEWSLFFRNPDGMELGVCDRPGHDATAPEVPRSLSPVVPARRNLASGALVVLVVISCAVPALAAPPPPTDPDAAATVDPAGRRWPMPIPQGCAAPELADVVFLGTVADADFQTVRYRIDQIRAGDLQPFAIGGLVDVRYGEDARFLSAGTQYLIGADATRDSTGLVSKVRVTEPLFAGDDVIGVSESELVCPQLDDPVRTLDSDGTAVDAGVLSPLADAKGDVLRSLLIPLAVALAAVFVLATVRWILTGVGKGVGSVVSTAGQTREVRAARRRDG